MPQQPQAELQRVGENLYRNATSKTYYVWVKVGGKQIKKSLKTKDRQLANRKKKDTIEKLRSAELANLTSEISFKNLSQFWLDAQKSHMKESSWIRREVSVKQLRGYFGKLPIKKINKRSCEIWAAERSEEVTASTYNKDLEVLILIFEYAIEHGYTLDNPSKVLKKRKPRTEEVLIPSHEQFETIVKSLKSLDVRYYQSSILVELLAYSGMRLGEATELRWADIDFNRGRFTIRGGETGPKNSEVRVVPLFPKLESFLKFLIGETSPDAQAWVSPIKNAKKAMGTICKMHKYPGFTHHSLRHYFCSNAIELGIDFKTIAAWLGHKDGGILVAKTYGHLRDTHSFEMAKLMK